MQTFKGFYNQLIKTVIKNKKISLYQETKQVKGMATYKTVSGLKYTKVLCNDGTGILILPQRGEIYYSSEYFIDTDIPTQEIGEKKDLEYHAEKFTLDITKDYQYITHLWLGDFDEIEGEANFSSYVNTIGNKILTLAILSENGKRADMLREYIEMKHIKIV